MAKRRFITPDETGSITEFASAFGITEDTMRKSVTNGEMKYVQVGNQILLRGQWVIDWIEKNAAFFGDDNCPRSKSKRGFATCEGCGNKHPKSKKCERCSK